jgi:glyoxylase I family protein
MMNDELRAGEVFVWTQDHVAFQVSDLDAALGFYCDVLGLRLMFREVDEEHHEAFAFLELGGGNLELLQALDEHNRPQRLERPAIKAPFCPHLALKADDLDAVLALLERHQVPVVKGPLEISGTVRWLYVADPDHNIIEFVQWQRES